MDCPNCFNDCVNKTTDRCTKYTGEDVLFLDIKKGYSLLALEKALITKLSDVIKGTGVFPEVDEESVCSFIISNFLEEKDLNKYNLNEFLEAILYSICELKTNVNSFTQFVNQAEAEYDIKCLQGVTESDSTHVIVQALINKICNLNQSVNDIVTSLQNNYVKTNQINSYIETYLNESVSSFQKDKMVPFTAIEYYGPLNVFDSTGKGLLLWDKIFLCNGNNGTPDKRGRVAVGAIVDSKGGTMSPQVDNAIPGNPNYAALTPFGSNLVNLSISQLPSHNHDSIVTITDPGHTHDWLFGSETDDQNKGASYREFTQVPGINGDLPSSPIKRSVTNITAKLSQGYTGTGEGHSNIQPVLPCHFIIYIP